MPVILYGFFKKRYQEVENLELHHWFSFWNKTNLVSNQGSDIYYHTILGKCPLCFSFLTWKLRYFQDYKALELAFVKCPVLCLALCSHFINENSYSHCLLILFIILAKAAGCEMCQRHTPVLAESRSSGGVGLIKKNRMKNSRAYKPRGSREHGQWPGLGLRTAGSSTGSVLIYWWPMENNVPLCLSFLANEM